MTLGSHTVPVFRKGKDISDHVGVVYGTDFVRCNYNLLALKDSRGEPGKRTEFRTSEAYRKSA